MKILNRFVEILVLIRRFISRLWSALTNGPSMAFTSLKVHTVRIQINYRRLCDRLALSTTLWKNFFSSHRKTFIISIITASLIVAIIVISEHYRSAREEYLADKFYHSVSHRKEQLYEILDPGENEAFSMCLATFPQGWPGPYFSMYLWQYDVGIGWFPNPAIELEYFSKGRVVRDEIPLIPIIHRAYFKMSPWWDFIVSLRHVYFLERDRYLTEGSEFYHELGQQYSLPIIEWGSLSKSDLQTIHESVRNMFPKSKVSIAHIKDIYGQYGDWLENMSIVLAIYSWHISASMPPREFVEDIQEMFPGGLDTSMQCRIIQICNAIENLSIITGKDVESAIKLMAQSKDVAEFLVKAENMCSMVPAQTLQHKRQMYNVAYSKKAEIANAYEYYRSNGHKGRTRRFKIGTGVIVSVARFIDERSEPEGDVAKFENESVFLNSPSLDWKKKNRDGVSLEEQVGQAFQVAGYKYYSLKGMGIPLIQTGEDRFPKYDLRGIYLSNLDLYFPASITQFRNNLAFYGGSSYLRGATFNHVNLREADFRESNLDLIKCYDVNFRSALFRGASLRMAKFTDCILDEIEFENCDLTGIVIKGGSLVGVDLSNSRLVDASIVDGEVDESMIGLHYSRSRWTERATCDIINAIEIGDVPVIKRFVHSVDSNTCFLDLSGLHAPEVSFRGIDKLTALKKAPSVKLDYAVLGNAVFDSTNLSDGHLAHAYLKGARFVGAYCQDGIFTASNMEGCNCSGGDFSNADLDSTRLIGSDFSYADLVGISLRDSDLRNVDLSGADLSNAYLEGSRLEGIHLDSTILVGIHIDKTLEIEKQARNAKNKTWFWERLKTDEPGKSEWRNSYFRAIETYQNLSEALRLSGDHTLADHFEYKSEVCRSQYRRWPIPELEFMFIDLSCGYGLKPYRLPVYIAMDIFIFASIYWVFGRFGQVLQTERTTRKPSILLCIYLSIVSFTTLGFAGLRLKHPAKFVTAFQSLITVTAIVVAINYVS